jgi:hypothetical protein
MYATATTVEATEALLPWNLKPVLDARRTRQEVPPPPASLTCSTTSHSHNRSDAGWLRRSHLR